MRAGECVEPAERQQFYEHTDVATALKRIPLHRNDLPRRFLDTSCEQHRGPPRLSALAGGAPSQALGQQSCSEGCQSMLLVYTYSQRLLSTRMLVGRTLHTPHQRACHMLLVWRRSAQPSRRGLRQGRLLSNRTEKGSIGPAIRDRCLPPLLLVLALSLKSGV